MHKVALKSVRGGIGDSAEPVWQTVIIQVPWGKRNCQLRKVRQDSEIANGGQHLELHMGSGS